MTVRLQMVNYLRPATDTPPSRACQSLTKKMRTDSDENKNQIGTLEMKTNFSLLGQF